MAHRFTAQRPERPGMVGIYGSCECGWRTVVTFTDWYQARHHWANHLSNIVEDLAFENVELQGQVDDLTCRAEDLIAAVASDDPEVS